MVQTGGTHALSHSTQAGPMFCRNLTGAPSSSAHASAPATSTKHPTPPTAARTCIQELCGLCKFELAALDHAGLGPHARPAAQLTAGQVAYREGQEVGGDGDLVARK